MTSAAGDSLQVDLYNAGPDSTSSITGIFIKNVLAQSPAGRTQELKVRSEGCAMAARGEAALPVAQILSPLFLLCTPGLRAFRGAGAVHAVRAGDARGASQAPRVAGARHGPALLVLVPPTGSVREKDRNAHCFKLET